MQGGLTTAKERLADDQPRSALMILHQRGRLDISLEALVLEARFQELFTGEELANARRRLGRFNYDIEVSY